MKKRIAAIVSTLPARIVGLSVALGALAGAAGVGWAGRGTLGAQMDLPREVARFEARVDTALTEIDARIDSTDRQIGELVRSQDRLTRQLERLVCVIEHEQQGRSTVGCETGP